MEGVEDTSIYGVPKSVHLRVWSMANQNAWPRSAVDLWIVCLDQSECAAANFAEVGQGRDVSSPYSIGSSPIQGGRCSKVG